jgi:hypothetical protein
MTKIGWFGRGRAGSWPISIAAPGDPVAPGVAHLTASDPSPSNLRNEFVSQHTAATG